MEQQMRGRRGTNRYSGSYSSSGSSSGGGLQTIVKYMFYMSVAALTLFVTLVFINYTTYPVFSFSVGDEGIVPLPLPTSVQTVYPAAIPTYDVSMNFVDVQPYSYSLSFDAFIQSEFAFSDTFPRVVLYRAQAPLTSKAFASSNTLADLKNKLIPNSNLIVYIDPHLNNMYCAVKLQPTDAKVTTYATAGPIQNLPIRSPFRVTLVFDTNFIEVYVDGKLESTTPFTGTPVAIDGSNAFYGPPQLVASAIKISNINYYSMMLSPKTIRILATQPAMNTGIFNAAA